jgi:D-3-phosphoglycerate dehydrogenase
VIGAVGTTLGKHGVNIASFALGRDQSGAVGVITVDESPGLAAAVKDLRALPAVKEAVAVTL